MSGYSLSQGAVLFYCRIVPLIASAFTLSACAHNRIKSQAGYCIFFCLLLPIIFVVTVLATAKTFISRVSTMHTPMSFQNYLTKLRLIFSQPKTHFILFLFFMICCLGLSGLALADGKDILEGTDASLIATLNGSGKKYIYLVEGFLSLAMYIKTKNLLLLFGIVIVAVFFNIVLKVAGATT